MKINLRTALFALTIILLPAFVQSAQACQCTEEYTPTCAIYWRAEFVFVARVKSVRREAARDYALPPNAAAASDTDSHSTAHLQIEEVLRGKISGEVLDLVGNGADCLLEYKKGRRYLIFADRYDPATRVISTSRCSRSTELRREFGDYLAELRSLSHKRAEASILGQIFDYWSDTPLKGIQVQMESNGRSYSTVTGDRGEYSFLLNQGGAFKVNITFPFSAAEGGYANVKYISDEPTRTVLGYEDTLSGGQCHYTELHVAKLPSQ